jgi:tRNA (cmo5U34)-methyltransferase
VRESAAAASFSAHAAEYDVARRRLVPVFDDFYGTAARAVRDAGPGVKRVLDLGAGTGLMSAEVLNVLPEARLTLVDGSEAMLGRAEQRLGPSVEAAHLADLAHSLPPGPFDAVVSALAIHHLEHPQQRGLLAEIHDRLVPGGVFVNAEQVKPPAGLPQDKYTRAWIQACRGAGAGERELEEALERMRHDRCTDVGTALGWLREAGFPTPDCVYKHLHFAVLVAVREQA